MLKTNYINYYKQTYSIYINKVYNLIKKRYLLVINKYLRRGYN